MNNAGRMLCGFVDEVASEDEASLMRVNVLAPASLAKAVLLQFRKQNGAGYIVQLGSVLGSLNNPSTSCYNASKAAAMVCIYIITLYNTTFRELKFLSVRFFV